MIEASPAIALAISRVTGQAFRPRQMQPVHGGCINTAFKLQDGKRCFFVKTNAPSRLAMFEAETEGLLTLAATACVRVPSPVCHGADDTQSFLVLEWVDLGGPVNEAELGHQLARLHQSTSSHFGWTRDNTLGSTLQCNKQTANWPEFFCHHRLGAQLELARRKGIASSFEEDLEALMARMHEFFHAYTPRPSLLHGDLWSGNVGYSKSGEPVIFDPAVYYGDAEADLAMTELFGGFGANFYAAYQELWPPVPGYATRKTLYNLYHILNHANLFGGSYIMQASRMARTLLAELN